MSTLDLIKGLKGLIVLNDQQQKEVKGGDPPPWLDPDD